MKLRGTLTKKSAKINLKNKNLDTILDKSNVIPAKERGFNKMRNQTQNFCFKLDDLKT
jgi:hypothetical protein